MFYRIPAAGVIGIPLTTSSAGGAIVRPMVKVQIPGSTGSTITLRPATSTIALAPKPAVTSTTASGAAALGTAVPAQTLTALKLPKVVTPALPQAPTKGTRGSLLWLFKTY